MAIKIPSKNIYEMNNPKIRDNVIDNVKVGQTIVSYDEEDGTIYKENVVHFETFSGKKQENYAINYSQGVGGSYLYNVALSYILVFPSYSTLEIKVPVVNNNHFISEFFLGKEEDEKGIQDFNNAYKIKYNLIGTRHQGTATAYIKMTAVQDVEIVNLDYIPDYSFSKRTSFSMPKEIKQEVQSNKLPNTGTSDVKVTGEIEIADNGNLATITQPQISIIDGKEYYVFSLTFLCGIKIAPMSYAGAFTYNPNGFSMIDAIGTYEEFIPEQIEISFSGHSIGISLTDTTIVYGNGKKPFELSGNELLQDSGIVYLGQSNIKSISEHLANNVLTQYEKGKETAKIRCSINDYYNESGEKVIDIKTNKMSFKLHDEVIPYVYGANGKDQPMSKYQDGTPKTFEVVGSNIIFDGAIWQEINLQEISKNH